MPSRPPSPPVPTTPGTVPAVCRAPVGPIRDTSALSRSPTSASPVGRNPTPHGTFRPWITTLTSPRRVFTGVAPGAVWRSAGVVPLGDGDVGPAEVGAGSAPTAVVLPRTVL